MVTEAVIQDVIGNVIEDIAGGLVAPPILATAVVWFDETTLQISGPDVTGWANKGTGGPTYDLIGRTSNAQGPFVSAFNGKNVANLGLSPNIDRKYFTPAVGTLMPQSVSFYIVAKQHTLPPAQHTLQDTLAGGSRVFIDSSGSSTNYGFSAGAGISSGPGTYDTLPHLFHATANGANGFFSVNNISDVGPINSGNNDMTYITLGANLNGFQSWDGWIAEVVILDYTLTTQESIDIENYLIQKWGV